MQNTALSKAMDDRSLHKTGEGNVLSSREGRSRVLVGTSTVGAQRATVVVCLHSSRPAEVP